VINFVAFIGWAPEDTQEIFTLEQLIDKVRTTCKATAAADLYCAAKRAAYAMETLSAHCSVFAGASAQGRSDRQHQQARLVQRTALTRQVH
jgi:glutamyl/glutaminyl-tRNA synthetase